jgi:hypothetical protein
MTENQSAAELPRRVVEFELKRPELHLPKVNLEPARRVAEDVLLTGIGIVVLTGRAVVRAAKAANAAGAETAEHPGPVAKALLGLVRPKAEAPAESQAFSLLPIADYDDLAAEDLLGRLPALSQSAIETLLGYEQEHQNRAAVVAALNARLA